MLTRHTDVTPGHFRKHTLQHSLSGPLSWTALVQWNNFLLTATLIFNYILSTYTYVCELTSGLFTTNPHTSNSSCSKQPLKFNLHFACVTQEWRGRGFDAVMQHTESMTIPSNCDKVTFMHTRVLPNNSEYKRRETLLRFRTCMRSQSSYRQFP